MKFSRNTKMKSTSCFIEKFKSIAAINRRSNKYNHHSSLEAKKLQNSIKSIGCCDMKVVEPVEIQ